MPRKMVSSEVPEDSTGVQYHISCKKGDVARYVLLPGDPGRVKRIAAEWDDSRKVAEHREYITYTGRYHGAAISCTSTGIGGPAAAIAIEELLRVGADTLLRVGTTGGLSKRIGIGDLIITTGAVRLDGTSGQYVMPGYPAVASYEVVTALVEAAERSGARYHVGITASSDSFYTGQGRPGFRGYRSHASEVLLEDVRRANVLNFEMETSTLFTLSGIYGSRAGSVCAVVANRETGEFVQDAGVDGAIRVANEAVKTLSQWDSLKSGKGKKNFFPSLLER
ncbi:MAG: uridine phosphorylase [Nitrososphaerota archaeon]|nr:uridine phosphorylase [Nitrososphaerota archaeon]